MHQLQEMLCYLDEALTLETAAPLHTDLGSMIEHIETLTAGDPVSLLEFDVDRMRAQVRPLLMKTSKLVRQEAGGETDNHPNSNHRFRPRSNLSGADLRGMTLRGLNLRSACLIAADLRDADLSGTDLLGADLRDADIRGANLASSLFVTLIQLRQAEGDDRTLIPSRLERPGHWAQ